MARENKQIMAYMKLSNYILHCASTAILSHVPSYNPIPVFNSEYCYTAPARINLFSWIPDALEKRVNYHAIFVAPWHIPAALTSLHEDPLRLQLLHEHPRRKS